MGRRLADLVEGLKGDPDLGPEVVHHHYLPPTPERFGDPDPPLPEPLSRALAAAGAERLWSHQAEGLAAARRGENVLVTTPTASGKSLVFQLPVLEEAAAGGPGKALFLFPLKALGQDQKSKFDQLARAAGLPPEAVRCEIYDGDTPRSRRARIKKDFPRVIVSNPDMLHLAVLSYWGGWETFLRDLRWVVLDELHTYRGIFGTHFHHVLQRFLRLVREARGGAEPCLIASSATAENADEFARQLTGRDFTWVGDSGAPREGRHLLLLRPGASPYTSALRLFTRLLEEGLKTIVFTKARRITELLYSWLRRQDPAKARKVASYRAGFLAEERRDIERRLFEGTLEGVISTSALEMGIDVGGLDACILVGYPGSMMQTWQRSGRVGRAGDESLTTLVALPDALDQWFLDHPEELISRPCERLIVDPDNDPVARAHLVCAAAELALKPERDPEYLRRHGERVERLVAEGHILRSAAGDELYSVRRRPQRDVSLRGTGATYAIHDETSERVIGTVDGVRALHEAHPGAVYLHAGRQWLIKDLDLEERRATAARARLDYFTTPLTSKDTEILEILEERRIGPLEAWLGRLEVTEWVTGFERKRIQSQEVLDQQSLDLPPTSFETVGLWWAAPPPVEETLRRAGEHFLGALHASEHAAISLFPLLALCDRGDIGGISLPFHPQVGSGAVFVYDGHPGGVGIAARGFAELEVLLGRVLQLVEECPCEDGCPSCIQSPKCGNGNRPLDKAGAARALRLSLGMEEAVATERRGRSPILPIPPEGREGTTERREGTKERRGKERRGKERDKTKDRVEGVEGPGEDRRGNVAVQGGWSAREVGWIGAAEPAPGVRGGAVEEVQQAGPEGDGSKGAGAQGDGSEAASGEEPVSAGGDGSERREAGGDDRDAGRDDRRRRVLEVGPGGRDGSGRDGSGRGGARRSGGHRGGARGREAGVALPAPGEVDHTVLFDLETLRSAKEVGGWGNSHKMGVAVGVVCRLEEGELRAYLEEEVEELVAALEAADLVVGFNVKRFDYKVLSGYTGVDYRRRLPTLDLLEEVHRRLGFRVKLDALARSTLGVGKSADGLQSLEWVQEGRLDLVEDYCRRDVEVLRDLYLFGRREGYVVYPDTKRGVDLRVEVEW